jgi:beta-aspartyl-dipeptidase (metallo-type)
LIVPGFIDQHVHLIGGGGEAGFSTRTPEVTLSNITRWGITTVVGCLGTDGITRHMTSLLAKARGLEAEGITTYIYSGSYEIPTPTITGSIRSDIVIIDKVVGAGEIAVSDHRSAQPTVQQLKALAAEARVGGCCPPKQVSCIYT